MKQKIVINVRAMDEGARAKAMKTVVNFHGVISTAVEGSDNSQLVVVGVGVDAAGMTKQLRKVMGHAALHSVSPVEAKKEEKKPDSSAPAPCPPCSGHAPHFFVQEWPGNYEPNPSCNIM